jgi:hypothetical protein
MNHHFQWPLYCGLLSPIIELLRPSFIFLVALTSQCNREKKDSADGPLHLPIGGSARQCPLWIVDQ